MQSAIPVQERPARNALTVGVSCVNRTQKHAVICNGIFCPSCLSFRSVQHSKPASADHGNVESEKELRAGNKTSAHFVLKRASTELRAWTEIGSPYSVRWPTLLPSGASTPKMHQKCTTFRIVL